MDQENGRHRVRAPLGDAGRLTLCLAARQCVRDEVLDVVVERVARALGYGVPRVATPALRLRDDEPAPRTALEPAIVEPRVDPWRGLAASQPPSEPGPTVRIMQREGAVLARIG